MIKELKTTGVAILALSFSGCTTGKAAFGPEPIGLTDQQTQYLLGTVNGSAITVPSSDEVVYGDNLRLMMARYEVLQTDNTKRNTVKRALAGALISQSNTICNAYLLDVFGYQNTRDSSLSISSEALKIAATALKQGATTKALTATSSFLTGANSTLESNLFGDKGYTFIAKAIVAERLKQAGAIQQTLNSSNLDNVPTGTLISDIQTYHGVCSLNAGRMLVTNATEAKLEDEMDESEQADQAAKLGEDAGTT